MKIDAYLTPLFPEKELQFDNSIVLMIDVLRASSTICAALANGAKEVITMESVDKAVQLFSSLSRESRFLGGERNGIKQSGFDAGNSPAEYTEDNIKGKNLILTTTNGTQLFQKCRNAKLKLVAGFINLDAVIEYVKKYSLSENFDINILCAGNDGRFSFEDTLCAGAYIENFINIFNISELSDSVLSAMNLFHLHKDNLSDFIKMRDHSRHLQAIGMAEDIDICLEYNKYPVVPVITGNSIKKAE